jgi:hypothetical protein
MRVQRVSSFTIVGVIILEITLAATIAFGVAQAYFAYSCANVEDYRKENPDKCEKDFPYPLSILRARAGISENLSAPLAANAFISL